MSLFGGTAAAPTAFGFAPPGASSTPAFGSAFGAPSAPATSAPASSSGGFAFGSTPAFGASAPTNAFGAASSPSPFGASSGGFSFSPASTTALTTTPAGGGAFSSLFPPAQAAAPAAAPFGQAPVAAASTFGQQQPTAAASVFSFGAKYEDLPPNVQQQLAQIQEEVSRCAAASEAVSTQLRTNQAAAGTQPGVPSLEGEAARLRGDVAALLGVCRSDNESVADVRKRVVRLLHATEAVVRTFQRTKLWREAPQQYKGQVVPQAVQEQLAAPVVLPSPFLEQAVAGFGSNVDEYKRTLSELEQVVLARQVPSGADGEAPTPRTLSTITANLHAYFIHVAARLERSDAAVQRLKAAYLAQQRAAGDYADPFARAQKQREHAHGRGGHADALPAPQLASSPAPPNGGAPAGGALVAGALGMLGGGGGALGAGMGMGNAFGTPAGAPFAGGGGGFGGGFGGAMGGSPGAAQAASNGSLSRSSSKTGRSAKKR